MAEHKAGTWEHRAGCPRLQAWDHGEYQAPCTCGGPYIVDKDGSLRDDYRPLRKREGEEAAYDKAVGILRCTHPDHVPGHDCRDRAVACSPHCLCCLIPESVAFYAKKESAPSPTLEDKS